MKQQLIENTFVYQDNQILWKYPQLYKLPKPIFKSPKGRGVTTPVLVIKSDRFNIKAVLGALILKNERADIIFLDGNKLNTELDNLAVKELLMDETITTKPIKELMS